MGTATLERCVTSGREADYLRNGQSYATLKVQGDFFFFKRRVNKTTETHDDPSNDEDVCSRWSPGTKQGSLPGSPCEPASGALCNVYEQCAPPSPILQYERSTGSSHTVCFPYLGRGELISISTGIKRKQGRWHSAFWI